MSKMPEVDVEVVRLNGSPISACYGAYAFAIIQGKVIDGTPDPEDPAREAIRELCQYALDNGLAKFVDNDRMSG